MKTAGMIAAAVLAAAAVVITLVLTLRTEPTDGEATGTHTKLDSQEAATTRSTTQLRYAHQMCSSTGELADNDTTLLVDVAGTDPGSGNDLIEGLDCVLAILEAPQHVIARMESTRALDGTQSIDWDVYEASWTYHPDAGIDVILTETP